MNELKFHVWLAIVGPIVGPLAVMWAWMYRKVERNDERWLETQSKILVLDKQIYAIMTRLNMQYADPNAPQSTLEK